GADADPRAAAVVQRHAHAPVGDARAAPLALRAGPAALSGRDSVDAACAFAAHRLFPYQPFSTSSSTASTQRFTFARRGRDSSKEAGSDPLTNTPGGTSSEALARERRADLAELAATNSSGSRPWRSNAGFGLAMVPLLASSPTVGGSSLSTAAVKS